MNFKKILSGVLACAVIGSAFPYYQINCENITLSANAEDSETTQKTYGLFTYEINENTLTGDSEITIIECDESAEGVVDIPNEIDGIPVTKVKNAFIDCIKITDINIPENITDIIILTENIESENESLLKSINVDENNKSYSSVDGILFSKDKTTLYKYPPAHKGDTYEIPETVSNINLAGFFRCQQLKSVNIPKSVETISIASFLECKNLEKVTIEYGVQCIETLAFSRCSSLKEIDIPSTVEYIYDGAFSYCTSLEKANIGAKILNSGIALSEGGIFEGCTNLADVTFSDTISYIGHDTFKDTKWFENQPDGMIYINDIAYRYKGEYNGDGEFIIKEGTVGISAGAFENIKGIKSIVTPKSLYEFNGGECIYCDDLESITFLNPECRIDYILVDDNIFPDIDYPSIYHGTIKGYDGSTAQAYSKGQGNEFIILDSSVSGIKGDANGDGTVDVADVVAVSAYVADSSKNSLDKQFIKNADVHNTGDGLTANDALMIQQYLSGTIEKF